MASRKIPVNRIPDDRPVYGADISDLAEAFEFTTLDSSYLLGAYMPNYLKMTSTTISDSDRDAGETVPGAERPITDPTRALMLRLISRHPEYCPIEKAATPHEVYEAIQQIPGREGYKPRYYGPLLGCEVGSSYRWNAGSGVTQAVSRYLSVIMRILTSIPVHERSAVLEELRELAEIEAATRGIAAKDLWEKGTWKQG